MTRTQNHSRFEQYKRIVKFLGSAAIVLLELGLYYFVWMNFYNNRMHEGFWRRGNWLVAGEYLTLLLILHRMYGGLKVGIYKYWNLVYSHMISILGVNFFSYVQVGLFDKEMHNPTALACLTVVDLILVMAWALAFKKLYSFLFPRKRLILVCGEESSRFLEELPQEGIRHERAQKTQDEPRAVQLSLFDIMGKS